MPDELLVGPYEAPRFGPKVSPWPAAWQVYWMYAVMLDDEVGVDAPESARRLLAAGVQARPSFLGMQEQPMYLRDGLIGGERYPVTERPARRGLHLPSGLVLAKSQVEQVCAAVRKELG